MTPNSPAELAEAPSAQAATAPPVPVAVLPEVHELPKTQFAEPKGCLYALSQPPLMLFLTVIAVLLGHHRRA